jgi:transcriptional regulator with XRE-family HTH domain
MIGDQKMTYDVKQCGKRIRQLRIQNSYTQEDLAGMLGIDQSFYGRVETGKRGCSVDLFVRLSDLFGVSLDFLILGSSDDSPLYESKVMQMKSDINQLVEHLELFKATL